MLRLYGIQTTASMADIAHSQRLLRVRLVCRGCKFRPFSHANSPRLSIVCVYAWRFWPIVSAFMFSQRQLSLSASMHNTPGPGKLGPGPARSPQNYYLPARARPGPASFRPAPGPARKISLKHATAHGLRAGPARGPRPGPCRTLI